MKEIAATIITETGKLEAKKDHLLIAVDGRCGSGKSTLGAYLQQKMHGNLLHMDDFYLRPEQWTPKRQEEPGGNVDRERFLEEVLLPLHKGTKLRIDHLTVGNGNWISRWRWKQGRSILWKGLILVIQSYMTTMIFMCF